LIYANIGANFSANGLQNEQEICISQKFLVLLHANLEKSTAGL